MGKERGEFFLASNEEVPLNGFVLTVSDIEIQPHDTVKVEHLKPIYCTTELNDADVFAAIGIIRRENVKGNDMLMMISPEATVRMT